MVLLPFSSLGDRIGHRRLYQMGQSLFMVASALCLLAHNFFVCCWRCARCRRSARAWRSASRRRCCGRSIPRAKLGTGHGDQQRDRRLVLGALAPTLGGYIVGHAELAMGVRRRRAAGDRLAAARPRLARPERRATAGRMGQRGVERAHDAAADRRHPDRRRTRAASWHRAGAARAWSRCVLLVQRERAAHGPVVPVDLLARPVLGLSALAAIACFIAAGSLMLSLPFRLEAGLRLSAAGSRTAAASVPADHAGRRACRGLAERPDRADQARRDGHGHRYRRPAAAGVHAARVRGRSGSPGG